MRNIILGMSAFALAAVATPVLAQDEATGGFSVSGNAAIVTDYRFRGISLSTGDVAIQGGIDVGHDSGFYIGTWGSSLADAGGAVPTYGAAEIDIYGGWSGEVSPGLTVDVGVLYYMYPNGTPGADLDYWEPYASISTTLGPVEGTFGVAYAPDQDSLGSDDNLYLYTDLGVGIPNTPISLSGHLGYTDGVLSPKSLAGQGDKASFDWSLGATWAVTDKLSLGVTYTGVEANSFDRFTDDGVFATLAVSF
tara:strand:+ start:565 stop:1314 length:750 start_codon:yes stop_codon:yes gene_type:complete